MASDTPVFIFTNTEPLEGRLNQELARQLQEVLSAAYNKPAVVIISPQLIKPVALSDLKRMITDLERTS